MITKSPACDKKVSIIMPVHNDEDYIKSSISSVLNQTYQNFELLIIDDCSCDESLHIAESFVDSRIKIFRLSKNLGAAAARNVGLKKAVGDYIAFLDADDFWLPKKLEIQLGFMAKHNCKFCCSQYYIVSQTGERLFLMDCPESITKKQLFRCCYIGCLTAIYDRKAVDLIQVDERLMKRNDYAIWLQVIEKTALCFSVSEPLACYRLNSNGISRNKTSLLKWHYRLFRWQLGYGRTRSLVCAAGNIVFSIFKKAKYRRPVKDESLL